MGLRVVRGDGASLAIGERWVIEVEPTDDDDYALTVVPTMVVTLPSGSTDTPTFEEVRWHRYRAVVEVASAGRYIAVATATDAGTANVAAFVEDTTAAAGMPDVQAYRDWDEDNGGSWTDAQIQEELDAEAAAQRGKCRVGALYHPDLRKALLRRVQRALAMRGLPLAVLQGDAEGGSDTILPGSDPEVRRLEGPHRRRTVG